MVTLDIEDTCIRMMSVRGRQVEAAASLPLEPGLVRDGVIIDKAAVSRRITELMTVAGINDRKVVTSVSGIHSIYRVVSLPKLPKKLVDEAARRELERAMPVPLNELYTSWQAVAISDIETTLCLIGLPRNTVDAMLDTLKQAGLQSAAMDVRPLALARISDERTSIVINVQSVSFDIVVMIDGVPEIIRSLPLPAETASVSDKIVEVKGELERTVTFYNSSHKASPIGSHTATFITGEMGGMLAENLDYWVKPLPPFLSYADSLNISEYAVNIGLALKSMRTAGEARVNINVTPEVYMPRPLPIVPIASWAFILVAAALIFLLGTSTLQSLRETQNLQAQVNKAQNQVLVQQGTAEAIKQMQTKIDDAKKAHGVFKAQLDNATAQREKVNGDLSKVTSLLPGIVELDSVAYSGGLTVTGKAPDETTIVNYVRALRNSGQFSEVLISNMNEIEYNEWQFTLTLQ